MDINNKAGDERITWVDCCKGICIVLVVFGHVVGGLEAAKIIPIDSIFLAARSWVYLFHMPAFFFLSGILAARSTSRTFLQFTKTRVAVLVYPYILWTGIILLSQMLMSRFANNPPDIARALRFYYEPYGYGLWFLYALFIASILFQPLARLRLLRWIILLLAIGLYFLALRDFFSFWPILNTALSFFVYFAAGAILGLEGFSAIKRQSPAKLVAVGICLMILMTAIQFSGWSSPPLLPALCGIGGIICIAGRVSLSVTAVFWAFLGFYSLEIFLGHALFGTLSRTLLARLGVSLPSIYVVSGVVMGVGISLLLAVACKRFDFPYLFRWPLTKCAGLENRR